MLVVGFLVPIYMWLAPKDIRQEVFDYTCKFVGVIVFIGIAYTLYMILLKDKLDARRKEKEQKALEQWQKENRERVERYRKERIEKDKREQ